MKKILALPLLFVALIAGSGTVHAAPPTPVEDGGLLPGGIFCDFDVSYTLTGKTKTITNGNVTTVTSPGQKITLTNEETDESVSYVITGVRREVVVDATPRDIIETVVTGRNIVVNNPDSDLQGIYVLVGEFNYAIYADNFEEKRVFSGAGRVIDVCAALS
ncbi:hypothetical protein [Arthrobacter sp. B10-11]|uniref:hypothetical protein n=1 Tax=Arthrobacter sp. B10-11 TaxID=3081160 RepID=UPI002954176D|nr:hypothetical protein [Arthrobacter sp. B10-11]MDV8149753.1 hypothetical protein [Arthrobacter sp. B10-11]